MLFQHDDSNYLESFKLFLRIYFVIFEHNYIFARLLKKY